LLSLGQEKKEEKLASSPEMKEERICYKNIEVKMENSF
jgi:hypothetical protein